MEEIQKPERAWKGEHGKKNEEEDRGGEAWKSVEKQQNKAGFALTMATRFLTLGAATIVTCLLISMGLYQYREAKQLSNIVTKRMNELGEYLSHEELSGMDGIVLRGSDVVNFYKRYFEEDHYLSFTLILEGEEHIIIPGTSSEVLTEPESPDYVRPAAVFYSRVVRSENDVVLGIIFEAKN